jgi:hypothetical protein
MSYSGKQNVDIEFDITARPKAWVKFHIKNVNPFDENDLFLDSDIITISGAQVDTTIIKTGEGNKDMLLFSVVTRNGVSSYLENTLYLPAYDTTQYDIFY